MVCDNIYIFRIVANCHIDFPIYALEMTKEAMGSLEVSVLEWK